jgi:CRP/FNR family transcriptional regulator, anaerobic regulatory protein
MFAPLLEYVNTIVPLNEEEMLLGNSILSSMKVKKGDIVVKEDEICDFIAYINKGYFRIFINQEIKETTVHLAGPGEFISAFSGYISRAPNKENIQAVTDGEIFLMRYQDLQSLYDKSHSIERLGRLIVEKHFVQKDKRVISMITDSAEVRYNHLMNKRPQYLLNIPLQYIASFLGVTPETLSRIRAKASSSG